eukprot:TRINITY_DN1038_c0_g1_i1.p1 TRINITY_DN1038_c0_g1~~TRINITY_DN1038_c0_g1_i1.p1  ORF type:complete len:334 (+),score=60.85 TRINITY_DN1038_c0_g1_i1:94-1095(+)
MISKVVQILLFAFVALTSCELLMGPQTKPVYVESTRLSSLALPQAFSVTYDPAVPPEAITAIDKAFELWNLEITTILPIEVTVNWFPLNLGVLSSESTYLNVNFANAPKKNVLYPKSLAKQYAGTDPTPGVPDFILNFNSDANWYYGLDGQLPSFQYDLVTVALHEIIHGLGLTGGASVTNNLGILLDGGYPRIYSLFIVNDYGQKILDFSDNTTALANQLRGPSALLYFAGKNLVSKGLGPARLFTPLTFRASSSYSHFNELSFPPGDPNSLFTPSLNGGEAIHDVGDLVRGALIDIGWGFSLNNTTQDPVLSTECRACCASQILPGLFFLR